jgi:hypothetical protein
MNMESILPEKHIRSTRIQYYSSGGFVFLCGLALYILDGSLDGLLMAMAGVFITVMNPGLLGRRVTLIRLDDDSIVFVSKKEKHTILLREVTRLSFRRPLFNKKKILGLYVFRKGYYGCVDFRMTDSVPLANSLIERCSHLDIKEIRNTLVTIFPTST